VQKDATREQILEAATKLLGAHGYAALRVASVAKEAGVSLGGHLHHFPSKEALVVAVLECLAARVLDVARREAGRAAKDEDILVTIARSAERFYAASEFLIYLDILLSVRRNTLVGDTAIRLLVSQRTATEAMWLSHLTVRGIGKDDAVLIVRSLWRLSRGLAISSAGDRVRSANRATVDFIIAALRRTHFAHL